MKTGLKPLLVGGALLMMGTFVVPLVVFLPLLFSGSSEAQFLIPGSVEFSAKEPGRYYLWNEYQTIFAGKTYNRAIDLSDGLEISIRDAMGQRIELVSDGSISSRSGSQASQSIGYVEIVQPGLLTVDVVGAVEPQVFSFAPSKLWQVFVRIVVGGVLSIVLAMAGVIVGVIGVAKLAQQP